MSLIEVKAKKGRIARTSPNGEFIPEDRYIAVALTPYIKRLLNVHKDIEQRPPEPKAPPAPAPKPKDAKKEAS